MPRAYQCRGCKGPPLPKPWPGERCPNCRRFFNWKEVNDTSGTEIVEPVDGEVISFQDAVDTRVEVPKIETGIAGIDHVLCGGLPPGALILLTGDPGAGKCLGRGTPVMLFDGRIVPVEEIKTGDFLMGPDSTPRLVKSTNTGAGPLYKIVPTKGAPWVCNDVHVLTLVKSGKKFNDEVFDIPLDVYLRSALPNKERLKLFQPSEVHFPSQHTTEDRPVSPYFIGIWLGDGTKMNREGVLKGIAVSKPDAEIEAACRDEAARFGLRVSVVSEDMCPTYRIVGEKGQKNPLLDTIRRLTRDGERVPDAYLYASIEVRAEVLAGLLDTDGHYSHGCYEIVQRSTMIADDIAFLARSLGLRVSRNIKTVNGEDYQRLLISGDATRLPLRIPRKRPQPRHQIKNALRSSFTVEPLGDGEFFGFTLDRDGRFLLGDFTVTHNTTLQMQMFQSLAKHRVSTLYISGEEDIPQLADRYHHLGKFPARMQALHETDLDSILYQVTEVKPQVVCLDSIQIVACTSGSGDDLQPGSAASVKIVCRELMQFAKENRVTFVAIGHINADGAISGPKSLIYYVDVVLHLQGGKGEAGRFLRCDDKNRFGKTPRKSRFTMTGDGDAGGGTLVDNYEEDVEAARLAVVAAEQDALNAERKAREKVDDLLDITDGDDDDEPDNVFTLAREARRAEPWVAADGTNEKVVLAVRCGVQDCRGSIGRACTSASGMREAGFHESRVEAARIEAASAPTVAPTPTEVVLAREEEEEKTTAQMPKALKAPPRVRKPRAKKTKPASPPSETPPDAPRSPR